MKLALVYPPSCDPTAPYLSLPALAGYLRPRGVEVTLVDANLEGYLYLFRRDRLRRLGQRVERRLAALERRRVLGHDERVLHRTLWEALGDAASVPDGIAAALQSLRDPVRFHDPETYGHAAETVQAALRVIAAAHAPLQLDFTSYRTPFALTSRREIAADAAPSRHPFHGYLGRQLVPRLRAAGVNAVGLSVCFPGQLLPAYAFALVLRRALPGVHLTVGGPAMTQLLVRQRGSGLATALHAFDSAVMFEGEHALLALCEALDAGADPARIAAVPGVLHRESLPEVPPQSSPPLDVRTLPAPDFSGMPLRSYLAPEPVLPYDPTRGCYWGRCAFCHYGLSASGTARYREREVATIVEHLEAMRVRYGARVVYFAQDSVAPRTLARIADALHAAGSPIRWATDIRPERSLTVERARAMRRGGAVACAVGVESASPRVLRLIDKGVDVETAAASIAALAAAGIAVEVMAFSGFPTENAAEARATLRFIRRHRERIAAFIVGRFELTHGSAVARDPARFGVRAIWGVDGDELRTGLFHTVARDPAPSAAARLEAELDALSTEWLLRSYPWAGSLSTAHSVLWYERSGPGVLRERAVGPRGTVLHARPARRSAAFDPDDSASALDDEREIWETMIFDRRSISRAAHAELAAAAQPQWRRRCTVVVVAGAPPVVDAAPISSGGGRTRGARL